MKKNRLKGYVILVILFILVNTIAFAVSMKKNEIFWISYVFTLIAFAFQIVIWRAAFGHTKAIKSKFLGVPIVYIGTIYLVVQIIAFFVFMSIPTPQIKSVVVTCAVIAGVSAICVIASDIGRSEINLVSSKIQEKTFFIKQLKNDVELLARSETDVAIKSDLMQLAEKIRYSDPVSDEQIANIESQITEKFVELRSSIDKAKIIKELNMLLDERNIKIKTLK